jgi:hypothetical protein
MDYNNLIEKNINDGSLCIILSYVIFTSNIELFKYLFTIDNLSYAIIIDVVRNPLLYPILEHLLEEDSDLCNNMYNMILKKCCRIISHDIASTTNIPLLKIILKYFPDSNIIHAIIKSAICVNNSEILNIIFANEYNIQLAFDEIMRNIDTFGSEYFIMKDCYANISININTIIWLDTHNINITNHLLKISMISISANDLIGVKYCLEKGYNATTILIFIHHLTDISIVKYLIEYGANINHVNMYRIYSSIDLFAILIEYGLDISKNVFKLALSAIQYNHLKTLSYIIQLYPDIVHQKDSLLLFYACGIANMNAVEILLNNGAHNDGILSFTDGIFYDRIDNIDPLFSRFRTTYDIRWTAIIKLLIYHGAKMINPQRTLGIIINSNLNA